MLRIVLVLFAGALAIANGGAVTKSAKFGEFNRYFLYTSAVPGGEELTVGSTSTSFINTRVTVVIVHGHQANYQTSLNPDLIRQLLISGEDLNIIAVDWSIYANLSFELGNLAIPSVGLHLATFLDSISADPALTHLIGFHMGAHIVGFTARRLPGIARITGLDPAKTSNRLARTDANYVEVIHTDAIGVLSNGLPDQLGHADFYPNGGGNQPGCRSVRLCNHERAWLFFIATIDGSVLNANCCTTILQKDRNQCGAGVPIPMGGNTLYNKMPPAWKEKICASGIYRVNTGATYPF